MTARHPGIRALRIVLAAFFLLPLVAHPSAAGFGDLMKKAKDTAAKATGQKPAAAPEGAQVVYDDVTLELTGDRLDHVITTLEKSRAAGSGRADLLAKLDQLQKERETLWDKNQKQIESARTKRDDVEGCSRENYQQILHQRMEEYTKKAMSDPAMYQRFAQAAAQYNEAAGRGDTTAINKLHEILNAEMLPTREDSATVRKKCGTPPPKSAAEARIEDLDKQIAALQDQIRAVDAKVANAQAEAGGMTSAQWAMALERIQMYLDAHPAGKSGSGSKSDSSSGSSSSASSVNLKRAFSEAELAALEKRLEKLRELMLV